MDKWDKIRKLKSLGEAPQEVSQNIQAPELAPKDNRFTGRTKRIAFTCRPEFAEELRKLAYEENCYQIEILERALEVYKKSMLNEDKKISFTEHRESQRKSKTSPKLTKQSTQQLNQFWKVNFICDNCQKKFKKSVVFSPAPDLDY